MLLALEALWKLFSTYLAALHWTISILSEIHVDQRRTSPFYSLVNMLYGFHAKNSLLLSQLAKHAPHEVGLLCAFNVAPCRLDKPHLEPVDRSALVVIYCLVTQVMSFFFSLIETSLL